MKKSHAGALVLACLSAPCLANTDCGNAQTQLEMNQCAAKEHEAADKELNAIYAAYRKSLDAKSKAALAKAQNAWIKFRDLSCAFETMGPIGGSIYPMESGLCLAQKTRARSEEIKKLSACEEGDLSCPGR
ncbi:MAG: lysozyme inhibitor LprI family protein [Burkholderiaceae bacterium]|jgi:uncharacterized protein YecT (DUF1311 family)|nr:lysozyme inhibitor LprI family protein [Burkholderiaceae bacterium]